MRPGKVRYLGWHHGLATPGLTQTRTFDIPYSFQFRNVKTHLHMQMGLTHVDRPVILLFVSVFELQETGQVEAESLSSRTKFSRFVKQLS